VLSDERMSVRFINLKHDHFKIEAKTQHHQANTLTGFA
jgi:hypothetical protein